MNQDSIFARDEWITASSQKTINQHLSIPLQLDHEASIGGKREEV